MPFVRRTERIVFVLFFPLGFLFDLGFRNVSCKRGCLIFAQPSDFRDVVDQFFVATRFGFWTVGF